MSRPAMQTATSDNTGSDSRLPLSALLSQALVAFTIELDNEFERCMGEAGFRGTCLSMTVWATLLRFLRDDGVSVRELAAAAFGREERTLFMLGCLERWGFISLDPSPAGDRPAALHAHRRTGRLVRDGFGSGRGIRREWLVRPTAKGRCACDVWPALFDLTEGRWRVRFGDDEIRGLRAALQTIVNGRDVELPDGLPPDEERGPLPPRRTQGEGSSPLPTLLSKALLGFAIEFNRDAIAPLSLCANVLRVVTESGVKVSDLARLTGGSPEVSAIGWRLKPYVVVEPSVKGRGRIARLTPYGLIVHRAYPRQLEIVEKRWAERFGEQVVHDLRASLHALFRRTSEGRSRISEGLVPPSGARRSGDYRPPPGLLRFVPAEHKRTREMAAQTVTFIEDPSGRLPHFPMWDMNRGFGP